MTQHFSYLVEIHFRQPDGDIAGHYTDEIRFENETAATPEEAGQKVLALYGASVERGGLLDLEIVSVKRHQLKRRRLPSGDVFPHG